MIAKIVEKLLLVRNAKRLKKTKSKFLSIGENCQLQYDIRVSFPEKLSLGKNVYIGPNVTLNALGGIEIENGVIIGPNVFIHSANHRFKDADYLPYDQYHVFKKVIIKENVWISANVCIVPGATIGEGSIIGMGAVVSGEIPPLSIVVGNPCKVISQRDKLHYEELKKNGKIYLEEKMKGLISPDYYTVI